MNDFEYDWTFKNLPIAVISPTIMNNYSSISSISGISRSKDLTGKISAISTFYIG